MEATRSTVPSGVGTPSSAKPPPPPPSPATQALMQLPPGFQPAGPSKLDRLKGAVMPIAEKLKWPAIIVGALVAVAGLFALVMGAMWLLNNPAFQTVLNATVVVCAPGAMLALWK